MDRRSQKISVVFVALFTSVLFAKCSTKQQPNTFRIQPTQQDFTAAQEQTLPVTQEVQVPSTKEVDETVNQEVDTPMTKEVDTPQMVYSPADVLWVIDNSASMDPSQDKLRKALGSFAAQYLKPNWDIRMAVITTDTYLANPIFQDYINEIVAKQGARSKYLASRQSTLVSTDGTFLNDLLRSSVQVSWAKGKDYARLIKGSKIHDGPITTMCTEFNPEYYQGWTKCPIRDKSANQGAEHCLRPTNGETAITQCLNTVNNDTIHSGDPVISSHPPQGIQPDANWQKQVLDQFMTNISVGTAGSGSERGLGSVLEFIQDNEFDDSGKLSANAFFRKGALHFIVYLSDEDDQTLVFPDNSKGFDPTSTYYSSNCPTKTVDGFSYRLTTCADPARLVSVPTIRDQMEKYFAQLDGEAPYNFAGNDASKHAHFVVAPIVATTGQTIQMLQVQQKRVERQSGLKESTDQDKGQRYIDLANQVGNGSVVLDIGANDYTQILATIGHQIVVKSTQTYIEKKMVPTTVKKTVPTTVTKQVPTTVTKVVPSSTFTLQHAATGRESTVVRIIHADNTATTLNASQYSIEGTQLTLTDPALIASFTPTDHLSVSYEPKTVY